MGRFRLLPLMAFAALCLLGLKTAGLVLSGSYTISGVAPASAQSSAEKAEAADDKTPAPTADAAEPAEKGPESDQPKGPETDKAVAAPTAGDFRTNSELAVLKSLGERRKTLEKHERELQLRENLLHAAEKRIEARISELKTIEGRITAQLKSRDEEREAQYDRLVKVYSSMKPKSAAKIFNRLDMDVLLGLAKQMKARSMSAILAAMDTAAAQRLTLEIAKQSQGEKSAAAALPKIESQGSR